MPANLTPEYYMAERKYLEAETVEEKIKYLQEMISVMPKHKGTDHLKAELRGKLAKLRNQTQTKAHRKTLTIAKEGDAQITITGMTNSGKSTLLSELTNAKPLIADYEFTTKKPVIGSYDYGGAMIQAIEIPSTLTPELLAIVNNSDAVIHVIDGKKDIPGQRKFLRGLAPRKASAEYISKADSDRERLKKEIWKNLRLIRVFTKEVGKPRSWPPLVLREGSTVVDMAKKIHKDFLKHFAYARVWGPSARFDGEKFGLSHRLKDGDIVEFHVKK